MKSTSVPSTPTHTCPSPWLLDASLGKSGWGVGGTCGKGMTNFAHEESPYGGREG